MKYLTPIKKSLLNIRGWRTKRKIVVIESDDWGTLRTSPNITPIEIIEKFQLKENPYLLYDALETDEDLQLLFNVLKSKTDQNNNHPVFTANCIVGNPDFEKIRSSNFTSYHHELVTETFNRFSDRKNCFDLWKQGIEENIFYPQLHGREHLNTFLWLDQIRNDEMYRFMFDEAIIGVVKNEVSDFWTTNSMAGCNYRDKNELSFIKNSLIEGLSIFHTLFGYKSKSFIANNYIWDDEIEKVIHNEGVRFIQGQAYQIFSNATREKTSKRGRRNYTGKFNTLDQLYIVRNCFFEPSNDTHFYESINSCLEEIKIAFFMNKPAVISSHRLNYIGSLDENNRKDGLEKLEILLSKILILFPGVEFLTTEQLGDYIVCPKS